MKGSVQMLKIAKGRISYPAVIGAVLFMIVQVIATLNLPSLTSNIVNNGVATGDISYIWKIGFEMIGFSLLSVVAAFGNVFLAARSSQQLGKNLRSDIYKKVINFSNDEFDKAKAQVKSDSKKVLGESISLEFEEHSSGWNIWTISPFTGKKLIIKEDGKFLIQDNK